MTGYTLDTIVGGMTTLFSNPAIQLIVTLVGSIVLTSAAIGWLRGGRRR